MRCEPEVAAAGGCWGSPQGCAHVKSGFDFLILRARVAQEQGRQPGPEGSLGKLASSYVARAANQVHTMITGTDAMLTGEDSPMDGIIAEILVSTPAISIAGGTDEIQKNIISERVLKIPKETRIDTDVLFREVLQNAPKP